MKFCTLCQIDRNHEEFSKSKKSKDGLDTKCKFCAKEYRLRNKEKIAKLKVEWYQSNKVHALSYAQSYYVKNRDNIIFKTMTRNLQKRRNDPFYRVLHNLRSRLSKVLKGTYSSTYAVKFMGCEKAALKTHLKSRFQPGMSWNNYGKWHIDHIKPLSSFNLFDEKEVKLACRYTNLQPLWAIDNLRKGNKV
jgi:hypothetical protein